jgi:hypothetical protein
VVAHALKNSVKLGATSPRDVVITTSTGKARRVKMHGLKAGWFYEFKVQAINKKGRGRFGRNDKIYLISEPAR